MKRSVKIVGLLF